MNGCTGNIPTKEETCSLSSVVLVSLPDFSVQMKAKRFLLCLTQIICDNANIRII